MSRIGRPGEYVQAARAVVVWLTESFLPPRGASFLDLISAHLTTAFMVTLAGLAGAFLTSLGPVTVITCQRERDATLSCLVEAHVLGLIPVASQAVGSVESVAYAVDRRDSRPEKNTPGDTWFMDVMMFFKRDRSVTTVELGYGWKFGTSADEMERRFNALVQAPFQTPLTLRQMNPAAIALPLVGLTLLAASLLLLALTLHNLLAALLGPGWGAFSKPEG